MAKTRIYRILANQVPEKKARTPGKQLSQVKDDLLQQALQQVKVLKAKLESSEHTDLSLLQTANEQIESLRRELNLAEKANRKLHVSLQELEELQARSEQSYRAKDRRLDEALRQIQHLQSKVESLKMENGRLKQQCDNEQTTRPDTHRTPIQLTFDLLSPPVKYSDVANNQSTVRETAVGGTEKTNHPTLLSAQEKVALFADLFAWRRDLYAVRWENRSTGKNGYSPARKHYEFHGKNSCPGPPACPNR